MHEAVRSAFMSLAETVRTRHHEDHPVNIARALRRHQEIAGVYLTVNQDLFVERYYGVILTGMVALR